MIYSTTKKGFDLLLKGLVECNETKTKRFFKNDEVIFRGGLLSREDLRICQEKKYCCPNSEGCREESKWRQSSPNMLVGETAAIILTAALPAAVSHYPGVTVTSQVNRPPTLT